MQPVEPPVFHAAGPLIADSNGQPLGPASVALEVQDVKKRYGALEALKGVSFSVPRQCVFCILGPNGAGKTTLLRILTTTSRPDSGRVFLEGMDVTTQTLAVRHRIGMVSQDDHFDRYLSIWHNLTLHAQMHGMPRSQYDPVIADWLDRLGLYARRHDAPDTLSGGMKRRVSLIRALIHRPSVLFLDEPTTGLDPQARREIWDTICAFKSHATILLTTHYMEEAEYLSDHILLMNHGEVVKQGTAASLKRDISPDDVFELVLERPVAEETQAKLAGVSGVVHIHLHDPFRLSVTLARGVHLGELMQHLHPADIQRIGRQQADLEQVFLSVAGRKQQAAEGSSGQQACLPP